MLLQLFNKEGDFAVLIKLIRVCLSLVSVTFVGELGSRVTQQGLCGIALVSAVLEMFSEQESRPARRGSGDGEMVGVNFGSCSTIHRRDKWILDALKASAVLPVLQHSILCQ